MAVFERSGAYRAAVLSAASKIMSDAAFEAWLDAPNVDLGGKPPRMLLDDPMGVRMVLSLLEDKRAA
ncbi:MAG: DUF2384 domain-containing protein [Bauldia sp.]|nr:DUF2384 domain-containing protein [Bauldia sp.]MCW5717720.1 DUF2384 domain-containing protein [Bauldia sp.]